MKITGWYLQDGKIANTEGETCLGTPYLEFLLMPREQSIKVVHHLDYFAAQLFKLCKLDEAHLTNLATINYTRVGLYGIRYIKGKMLSIKKTLADGSSLFCFFNNMDQYV